MGYFSILFYILINFLHFVIQIPPLRTCFGFKYLFHRSLHNNPFPIIPLISHYPTHFPISIYRGFCTLFYLLRRTYSHIKTIILLYCVYTVHGSIILLYTFVIALCIPRSYYAFSNSTLFYSVYFKE